jgi:hypothetical protein
MSRLSVKLAFALALGFAAGCVSSKVAVPAAHADSADVRGFPASSAQRWEYMCVDGWSGITHAANQLGKEGWEMASAAGTSDHMMWCFKRPAP